MENVRDGLGVLTYVNGDSLDGYFRNGHAEGIILYRFAGKKGPKNNHSDGDNGDDNDNGGDNDDNDNDNNKHSDTKNQNDNGKEGNSLLRIGWKNREVKVKKRGSHVSNASALVIRDKHNNDDDNDSNDNDNANSNYDNNSNKNNNNNNDNNNNNNNRHQERFAEYKSGRRIRWLDETNSDAKRSLISWVQLHMVDTNR